VFVPLKNVSHYSILQSTIKPVELCSFAANLNIGTVGLADITNVNGAVQFVDACKDAGLKPIISCTFVSPNNTTYTVVCKNLQGWRKLLLGIYQSNSEEYYHTKLEKPRLPPEFLARDNNLLVYVGGMTSGFAPAVFTDVRAAFMAPTYDAAKRLVSPDWEKGAVALAQQYREWFGENLFLEVQFNDAEIVPANNILSKIIRHIAKKNGFRCLPTWESYYLEGESAIDHRVLLCSKFKTTLRKVEHELNHSEEIGFHRFFSGNTYNFPLLETVSRLFTEEEVSNTQAIADQCETFSLSNPPFLPNFECPGNTSALNYLDTICRKSLRDRNLDSSYIDRYEHELSVLAKANLASYFLIVYDYMNFAREKGWWVDLRGSAGGCLVSNLLGMSSVDPIKYNLLFERFYNEGRNSPGRIALPDIDCDVPKMHREEIFAYIRKKYGESRVAQISTYGRIQGKAAIKEVLRVNEVCGATEMSLVTKAIPNESLIAGDLQEMREEEREASIILWALENRASAFKEWVHIDKNGEIQGEGGYPRCFKQAIRLEGTIRSRSKHAAGIVVCSRDIREVCPMVRDKKEKGRLVTGLAMDAAEKVGLLKMDLLGVALHDKLMIVRDDLC
jgi:DNA polymerase-3 subunit alpha